MSYVTNTLSKDEEIMEIGKLHWSCYIFAFSIAIFALLFILVGLIGIASEESGTGPVILGIIFGLWALYSFIKTKSTEIIITNKRVILKRGLVSIRTEELKNAKIESVQLEQSSLGRALNYGTIYLSGTGTAKMVLSDIENPLIFKGRIETIIGD